jgi:DNA mismatch repair ATPase MutL
MKHKPAFILDIRLPAGYVDVNLTPDKREVLIVNEKIILEMLKNSVDVLFAPSRYTLPVQSENLTQTLLPILSEKVKTQRRLSQEKVKTSAIDEPNFDTTIAQPVENYNTKTQWTTFNEAEYIENSQEEKKRKFSSERTISEANHKNIFQPSNINWKFNSSEILQRYKQSRHKNLDRNIPSESSQDNESSQVLTNVSTIDLTIPKENNLSMSDQSVRVLNKKVEITKTIVLFYLLFDAGFPIDEDNRTI